MTCTTENCGRTTTLYLCTACIVELDGLLKDVPDLIGRLGEVREGTAVIRKSDGGNGGHAGSKPPGSLNAWTLQAWLTQLPERAQAEAVDNPEAGRTLYMARIWVPSARELCWGPTEPVIDHDKLKERVQEAYGEPLPPKEAIEYLRTKAKLSVKMFDFKNWVKHGHLSYVLDRVSTDDSARKIYYPGDVFRVAQRMRERRIKIW